MQKPLDIKSLIEEINRIGETFKKIYDEHINDNSEVLSYLLFADYSRHIENLIKNDPNNIDLEKILNLLNIAIEKNDQNTQDVIFISFIETLSTENYKFIQNSKFTFLKNELEKYLKFLNK